MTHRQFPHRRAATHLPPGVAAHHPPGTPTPTNGNLRATFIESMSAVWKGEWSRFYPGNAVIDVIGFDGKVKSWDSRYVPARNHYDDGVRVARRQGSPLR